MGILCCWYLEDGICGQDKNESISELFLLRRASLTLLFCVKAGCGLELISLVKDFLFSHCLIKECYRKGSLT